LADALQVTLGMMLFRLLTTGVCVACVVMLATIRPIHLDVAPSAVSGYPPQVNSPCGAGAGAGAGCEDRAPPVSTIDVAHGVAPGALAALLHLRPTEWVSAINDRTVDSDLPVDALIAPLAPRAGEFLDLTVASATSERRVLVLLH
jgi:hypothetical protein